MLYCPKNVKRKNIISKYIFWNMFKMGHATEC